MLSLTLRTSIKSLCRPAVPFLSSSPHRRNLTSSSPAMVKITPVPVRDDNYSYILSEGKKGVFVDVYDLSVLQSAAKKLGVEEVEGLISTHHHYDHTDGNKDFATAYPHATIWGGSSKVPNLTKQIGHLDTFPLFKGSSSIKVTGHATPCHTQDSVCFFVEDPSSSNSTGDVKRGVFTGDTLFISGCGRFFEGTPEEMNKALNQTLSKLPDDTIVFCGHEYTRSNVAFSLGVLPDRQAIQNLASFVREGKNKGVTTGIFTIGDEKKHNVFMLVNDDEVKQNIGLDKGASSIETMAKLRELKNEGKMQAKI